MIKKGFSFLLLTLLISSAATSFASNNSACTQTLDAGLSFPNELADNQMEMNYLKNNPDIIEKLNREPVAGGPLSLAQKVAIAWYTISYAREEAIIINGAKKLPAKTGTFYRGQPSRYTEKHLGQITSLQKFQSVSVSRYVAEGFLDIEKASQLLIINAKTARDISRYSQGTSDGQIQEEEALLLPGTKLRVDKIYPGEVTFEDEETGEPKHYKIEIVELTEVNE